MSEKEEKNEMVEHLASYAHDAWTGWMKYMFSKSTRSKDGRCLVPANFVTRWHRQMTTHYVDLPEGEKESGREEARKMLDIMVEDIDFAVARKVMGVHLGRDWDLWNGYQSNIAVLLMDNTSLTHESCNTLAKLLIKLLFDAEEPKRAPVDHSQMTVTGRIFKVREVLKYARNQNDWSLGDYAGALEEIEDILCVSEVEEVLEPE